MKAILKKIFPIVWLKKGFLLYNKLRISTIDKYIYKIYHPKQSEIILSEEKNPFLEAGVDLSKFDNEMLAGFSRWTDPTWTQDQYIVAVDCKLQIDPKTGWAIVGENKLVYASLGFSRAPYVVKPDLQSNLRLSAKKLNKVISLRDTGEENFFHFYNDVIPKIWFLMEHDLFDPALPLIISETLWRKDYFQYFKSRLSLDHLNWYVQRTEWLEADGAIFCKPFTHTFKYWQRFALKTNTFPTKTFKRVYLKRPKTSLRYIENEDQVMSVLKSFGFVMIDANQLSFPEQVELFSHVNFLVAVHGAGESNILFRNEMPLSLLEIFHPNEYLPYQYILLCRQFNFQYNALQGKKGQESSQGGFIVDCSKLEQICRQWVNA